jgi:hypothetical protein
VRCKRADGHAHAWPHSVQYGKRDQRRLWRQAIHDRGKPATAPTARDHLRR